MTVGRLALAVCTLVALAAPDLAAQPSRRDPDRERARELFERAVQLMENQDWSAALVQLEASFRLQPTQVGLFNMGLCYKGLRRYGAAIGAFQRLVDEFADRGSEARVALARTELRNLRGLFGTVEVRVDVPGAEITVDGTVIGTAPLAAPLELAAGNHVIRAHHEGRTPAEHEVGVIAGAATSVELTLRAIEAPELAADHPPPDAPPSPPPPDRPVRRPRRARGHSAPAAERHGLRPVWFWSTAGLAAAGAVTTTILGALVVAGDADYRASRPRLASDRDAGKQLALFTDVALGVAIVAAVGAVLLYGPTEFAARPDVDGASARRRPRLSPSLAARAGTWSIGLSGEL